MVNPLDGVCSGVNTKLSTMMGSLDTLNRMMQSPSSLLNDELNKLTGMTASPINEIESGLSSIESGVTTATPDIPDVSDIEDMLKECGLLKNDLLNGATNVLDFVGDFVGDAADFVTDAIDTARCSVSGRQPVLSGSSSYSSRSLHSFR